VRNVKKLLFSTYLITLTYTLTACQNNLPNGHYEGTLSSTTNGSFSVQTVEIDFNQENGSYFMKITNSASRELISTALISNANKEGFDLLLPMIQPETFSLKKDGSCYTHHSFLGVEFCFDDKNLLVRIHDNENQPVLTLSGNTFNPEKPYDYEKPAQYTLKNAIDHALDKNFNSLIEFQRLIQAKKATLAAYLGLFPRINPGSIGFSIPFSTNFIYMIGDLAPFLLPNRWFEAKSTGLEEKAKDLGILLMQADLATEVEGLAYAYERDRKLRTYYLKILDHLASLQNFLSSLNPIDPIRMLFLPRVELITKGMTLDLAKFETLVQGDRFALAQSLGLHNPEGVEDLTIEEENPVIEKATSLEKQEVANIALRRSFELRQIDFLIESARINQNAVWYNWIDPQNDPKFGLGPHLVPMFAIEKSKLTELLLKREEIQTQVVNKAFLSVLDYNTALEFFKLSEEAYETSTHWLQESIDAILARESLDVDGLEDNIGRCIGNFMRVIDIEATFRIARSKIDRMHLKGYYLRLLDKILSPREETPKTLGIESL